MRFAPTRVFVRFVVTLLAAAIAGGWGMMLSAFTSGGPGAGLVMPLIALAGAFAATKAALVPAFVYASMMEIGWSRSRSGKSAFLVPYAAAVATFGGAAISWSLELSTVGGYSYATVSACFFGIIATLIESRITEPKNA